MRTKPQLSRVEPPWWDDKPLAIVGTGPSLRGFDFSRFDIPGVRVLAVKEAVWELPFAECVFGLDRAWINRQADKLNECNVPLVFAYDGERECAAVRGGTYIQRKRHEGFSDDLGYVQSGGNSGFGAVNYAYLKRAKVMVLFGFDYLESKDGHHHKSGGYPWYRPGQNARYWKSWGDNFDLCLPQLKKNSVEIINASPISTVSAFPKVTIESGLEYLARLGASGSGGICRGAALDQTAS